VRGLSYNRFLYNCSGSVGCTLLSNWTANSHLNFAVTYTRQHSLDGASNITEISNSCQSAIMSRSNPKCSYGTKCHSMMPCIKFHSMMPCIHFVSSCITGHLIQIHCELQQISNILAREHILLCFTKVPLLTPAKYSQK